MVWACVCVCKGDRKIRSCDRERNKKECKRKRKQMLGITKSAIMYLIQTCLLQLQTTRVSHFVSSFSTLEELKIKSCKRNKQNHAACKQCHPKESSQLVWIVSKKSDKHFMVWPLASRTTSRRKAQAQAASSSARVSKKLLKIINV